MCERTEGWVVGLYMSGLALQPLWAGHTLRTDGAVDACRPLRPILARRALRTGRPIGTLRSGNTIGASRPRQALRARGPLRAISADRDRSDEQTCFTTASP